MKKRNERNTKYYVAGILLLGLAAAAVKAQALPVIVHQPPGTFYPGVVLVLKANVMQNAEWLTVFWRGAGAEDFSAQNFSPANDGSWEVRIDTSGVTTGRLEYYLAGKAAGQIGYLPERIPDTLFSVTAGGPPPEQPPPPPPSSVSDSSRRPFPFQLDASIETRFNDQAGTGTAADPSHTENLRLNYRLQKNNFNLELQSRASYSNLLSTGQTAFDLPDLRVQMTSRSHALRLGDIAPMESELSIAGMGRRGLEYIYDDQRFYAHLFGGSTQQLRGFKGLGIPESGAALYGGAAGITLFSGLSLKTVYLAGQDDPALGASTAMAPFYDHKRKGDVLSFIGQSKLFRQRLTLTAEYAKSKYDPDTDDSTAETSGSAYRINGALQLGRLDLRVGYKNIGTDFNSIAQPFFQNDRKGFDASASVALSTLRLSGALAFDKTNADDDPERVAARDFRRQLDLSWQFWGTSNLRLGYSSSRQDARLNNNPVLQGNLNREGVSAGVSLGLSPSLRLGLEGRSDALSSADNPELEGSSLAVNVTMFWQVPERVMLSSVAGISRTKNTTSGEQTTLTSVFLNADVTLVARLLSLNATASYFSYDLSGPGPSKSVNANGGLCLHLKKLLQLGDIVLSLRGGYLSTDNAGTTTHDSRLYMRCDIAL